MRGEKGTLFVQRKGEEFSLSPDSTGIHGGLVSK